VNKFVPKSSRNRRQIETVPTVEKPLD